MKLNIANPSTGCQKLYEIEDEKKLRTLYDKRLATEVDGSDLGEEFAGYIFKVMGGQDKQGFPMKQGVLTADRVRLMMAKGDQGCRGYGMRKGERYRKSCRGCIISHNIAVLHLVIVKKGDAELEGLTDKQIPRRLGPKRASKIRKLFALSKEDDVRKYVIRREVPAKSEDKKPGSKAPKIQRLVTPISLQRKRHRLAVKKARQVKAKSEAAAYQKLLALRQKEAREKKAEKMSQRRSQRSSQASM
ncbi:hypothetical protein EMIHUDRAFT_354741 [Emiliania huxleyi CCMP1516]|jgi:small subunit ribosomal protein S6e|uniref:40S ribosomal protein S6 n=3 Tax=Eukaryota TaxID=2759 RepID=A0A0D3JFJ3_EMIH1|nr:hypothetical protein EMIHUDRAFT_354741 [Emiliania huxleyi CCMP1516]EOD22278.1 hypothetical protein EMIHUDRAFT_354741 [Emiliania huxleyi CCMP1516]|mmetsp:Transcript_7301/g.24117  ORF Transcript_7301/g.24117 Transcript_7301/m.24117 type:complete len:246 (-) Transcript_7301:121-858(-)|eukprot:XP_005774707.1 hypothetical protein EMIHUDRAFT_354741 [Emiliania huxleyi CCMP1516]